MEVNIAEILHVASLMQVCCVLDVAEEYIIHNINSKNCSSYFELANLHLLEAVQSKAIQSYLLDFNKI